MIKINKITAPATLQHQGQCWQKDWTDILVTYGGQELVPDEVLAPLKHYRHPDIVQALFTESGGKCVYCESLVEPTDYDVEHFLPKPLYPSVVFSWENLLAVCKNCNALKANFDNGRRPIVNPSSHDPKQWFSFNGPIIVLADEVPDPTIATLTIKLLQLNRTELVSGRNGVLASKVSSPGGAHSACWQANIGAGLSGAC